MRRFMGIGLVLLLLCALAVPVSAATEASSASCAATVYSDGSCQISMTVTLHLDQGLNDLNFPIPAEATGVTLNGGRVNTSQEGSVRQISLEKLVQNPGDVTFSIQYSLSNVVVTGEDKTLQLQLPLLSGFAHPIRYMEFSITLPGEIKNAPGFFSGYHQNRIEEDLSFEVSGATVFGSSIRELKDHETLMMTMAVDQAMFPNSLVRIIDYNWATLAMLICGGCALLYWLLTMFNRPGLSRTQPEMPQGYHAGNLGSALTGRGFDLTMAVMQWAQLGYILIHVKGPKVFLYKRMDMGNERSDTELRWFKKLFAKGSRVDTSTYRYGKLCCLAAQKPDRTAERMKRWNGNPKILRILTSGVGLFAGISLAVTVAPGAALLWFLMLLFGAAGAVSSWYMQVFGYGVLLRDHRLLKGSLFGGSAWLILSLAAGAVQTGILLVAEVYLLALLLAWGGRRTSLGRLVQMQTLGFARYLEKADKNDLQRLCRSDPEYFFRLAPGALALGREKIFAKRFGDKRLEGCLYLTSGMDGHMTALQWSVFMRNTVDKMNVRANRMGREKFLRILSEIRRG